MFSSCAVGHPAPQRLRGNLGLLAAPFQSCFGYCCCRLGPFWEFTDVLMGAVANPGCGWGLWEVLVRSSDVFSWCPPLMLLRNHSRQCNSFLPNEPFLLREHSFKDCVWTALFFKQLFEHFIGEVVIHQHLDAQCFGTEKSGKRIKWRQRGKIVEEECFGDWHSLRRWKTAWKLRLTYKLEEGRGSDWKKIKD